MTVGLGGSAKHATPTQALATEAPARAAQPARTPDARRVAARTLRAARAVAWCLSTTPGRDLWYSSADHRAMSCDLPQPDGPTTQNGRLGGDTDVAYAVRRCICATRSSETTAKDLRMCENAMLDMVHSRWLQVR